MKYDLLDLVSVAIATSIGASFGQTTAIICAATAVVSIVFWERVTRSYRA